VAYTPTLPGRTSNSSPGHSVHCSFLHLFREDVVAQAVSRLRAEQTGVWFETDESRGSPEQEPHYDRDAISRFVHEIEDHNTAWADWFTSVGVAPLALRYEDLALDPTGVTERLLDSLGLQPPPDPAIVIRHRRLANDLNGQWAARYRIEMPHP